MLRTSLWLAIFLWSLCAESLYLFNLFLRFSCFSLYCFGCVLFSKIKYFALGFSFEFFVFYFVLVKLENGFQKNNLSSFNLVLIWFWYRGVFFLSLCFCDVSKLRWLVQFSM